MTESYLGFKIDSSPAASAAVDLDRLTSAAVKTEAAAESLVTEMGRLGGAVGRASEATGRLKPSIDGVARSFADQDEHVQAFRMEVERLTLRYQPLAQATRNYESTVSELDRAHKLGILTAQQYTAALDKERLAFERLKTSAVAADAAVKAANNNQRAGGQGVDAANIGYQFQDVAVTAAMGMNPLMIGLQQGTQLASVVGSMERPVAGLAAAFMSLVSPVSLVTIGLTAGAAALIQYGSSWFDGGGDKLSGDLEAQADLIRQVADRWGDAVPALRDYANELERARDQADLAAGVGLLNEKTLAGTRSGVTDVTLSIADLVSKLQSAGEETDVVLQLQSAFDTFSEAARSGSLTVKEVNDVQLSLTAALGSSGIPAIASFREEFDKLAKAALEAAGNVQKVTEQAAGLYTSPLGTISQPFSEGGRLFTPEDFIPGRPGVPTRRPSDLDRDPDPVDMRILNSDGRLTNVPVPGQRPNFFELEETEKKVDDVARAYQRAQEAKADFWLDVSFDERQRERSAIDRQVALTLNRYGQDENLNSPEAAAIRQQIQWKEAKDAATSFGQTFSSTLVSSGGDIGKSFADALKGALERETAKLWDRVFDGLGTMFANWLTGSPAQAGGTATATGAGAVARAFMPANDNALSAPVTPVTRGPLPGGDIASYIANAARQRGIDPDVALRVAKSEGGLDSWNLQSNYYKNGVREPSYGPFQLYKGGGLGNAFQKATGMDPADAASGPAGVDFALDHAKKNGWGAWYGADRVGISKWEGINANPGMAATSADAVNQLAEASKSAAESVDILGSGMGKMGNALSAFPAAPSPGATGGGGGGLFGWLGNLFGGFTPNGAQATLAASGSITGMFAGGTNNAPGGLSVVGERGPELLNLPQGSGVVSNHKLMEALAQREGGQGGIAGIRLFVDQDGNWQAKVESLAEEKAKSVSRQNLGGYKQNQQRSGYGDDQKRYISRKG